MPKKRKGRRGGQRQRRSQPARRVTSRREWLNTVGTWVGAAGAWMAWFRPRQDDPRPRDVAVSVRRLHDVRSGLRPQPLRVAVALRPPWMKQLAATLEGAPGSLSVALTKSI